MTNRAVQPDALAPPAANYVHAVLSESPQRLLHTSGVVPTKPDGTVPSDIGEQAEEIWRTIGALLDEAALSPSDVVSVTTYVIPGQPLDKVMAARDAFFGEHRAASTLLTVAALARPEWLLEIAVVAVR